MRKPSLVHRILRGHVSRARGNIPLRTVELALTYRCQCSCPHCYADTVPRTTSPLGLDEMTRVIDDAVRAGAFHFILTGGEPLLYGGLFPLLDHLKKKQCIVTLATNGLALTRHLIRRLKNSGIDLIEVSIDYPSQHHDAFRGVEGCYSHAIDMITAGKESGIPFAISTVLTQQKMKDAIPEQMLTLSRQLGCSLGFCFITPNGRWRGRSDRLTQADWSRISKMVSHPSVQLCERNTLLGQRCPAGREKIAITPYGDVFACHLIQYSYGNVRDEHIGAIRDRMVHDTFLAGHDRRFCLPAYNDTFTRTYLEKVGERDEAR